MVFSSLATDLSANSARVSACNTKPCNTSDKSAEEVLICFLTCLTSFSFSVSTLISSSYLSSFCEYCSTSTEQHHQHTSVTAHRGGKKKNNTTMLAGDTQIQPQWWVLQILLYLLSLGLQWLQVVGDIFQLFFKVTWFTEGHEKEGKQKRKRKQRQQFETKNRRWRGDQTNPGSEGQVNMSLWLKPHLEAEFIHEKQYCIWKRRILKPITTSNEQQKHKRRKYYNFNSPIYLHSHVFFIYLSFFYFLNLNLSAPCGS